MRRGCRQGTQPQEITLKPRAGALLVCMLTMVPAAVFAQTQREAILMSEDYDLTVEQACAVDDVAA